MPFPFVTSTTSHLTFQHNFTSATHPSLPSAATAQRDIVRSILKTHKRLPVAEKASNLITIVSCLSEYLKYLLSIDNALSGRSVSGEDVDVALTKDVDVEWRPSLAASSVPGRDVERVKGRGLDYEIYFIHQTYAVVQNLLARQSLLGLFAATNPTTEQRLALIQSATRHLKSAYSIHAFLTQRTNGAEGPPSFPPSAVDVSASVQSALQRLTQAEFNLLCVLKDDPYPALLVQTRNKDDKEWMIKAPDIPKVRAQVLTRLCVGASEHAAAASATLKAEGKKVLRDLLEYVDDVKCTSRARACRFQALENDLAGQTGQGIAWLHAGLNELGVELSKDGSKVSSLSKLKSTWNERKEDKRVGKGSARWGIDGGKAEESRILEYLERKLTRANNTIVIQAIPEWRPLLATLPSGMHMPIDEKWRPALLAEDELTHMRAPPDLEDFQGESSGEEDANNANVLVGSFPDSHDEYSRSTTSYY